MWNSVKGVAYPEGHHYEGHTRDEQPLYLEWNTKWTPHTTHVILPGVYMDKDESLRATELKTLLRDLATSEGAKFITGTRPLSEVDDFYKELESLGVQDYIDIYAPHYAEFEKTLNGK